MSFVFVLWCHCEIRYLYNYLIIVNKLVHITRKMYDFINKKLFHHFKFWCKTKSILESIIHLDFYMDCTNIFIITFRIYFFLSDILKCMKYLNRPLVLGQGVYQIIHIFSPYMSFHFYTCSAETGNN